MPETNEGLLCPLEKAAVQVYLFPNRKSSQAKPCHNSVVAVLRCVLKENEA